MGIRATYTEISPEDYRAILDGDNPNILNNATYSIDSSWYDYHAVFSKRGHPLDKTVSGTCAYPDQHEMHELIAGDRDYYAGLFDAILVHDIAEILKTIMTSQYEQWSREINQQQYEGTECGVFYFDDLKNAFIGPSQHGNALMITIA